jgi:mannose-6-phosphate isomerase-like protein (cupin superfamily)
MSEPPRSTTRAHLRLGDAIDRLPGPNGEQWTVLFEHGTLEVEIYAPVGTDPQQPHRRDEVYVVARGSGTYFDGNERRPVMAGDIIFAPAGSLHRFEEFTPDFAVWVLFYGPDGGEPARLSEPPGGEDA